MKNNIEEAFQKVEAEVLEGLKHGHYKCTITCETIKGNKRQLLIQSGKSYSFILKEEDINRYN